MHKSTLIQVIENDIKIMSAEIEYYKAGHELDKVKGIIGFCPDNNSLAKIALHKRALAELYLKELNKIDNLG